MKYSKEERYIAQILYDKMKSLPIGTEISVSERCVSWNHRKQKRVQATDPGIQGFLRCDFPGSSETGQCAPAGDFYERYPDYGGHS